MYQHEEAGNAADGGETMEQTQMADAAEKPIEADEEKEEPKRPLTMMSVLAKLEEIQAKSKCGTDLSEFIMEYVDASMKLSKNNRPIIAIWDYLGAKFLLCKNCFHPNVQGMAGHLDPACKEKCCGIKRCKYCFHPHDGVYCTCTHTIDFFSWFEKNLKQ